MTALFKSIFWRSVFWLLLFADGHGVKLCSRSPWMLSIFPQSCGSVADFLIVILVFSSAMSLRHTPHVLLTAGAPAHHHFYPSPQSLVGFRAGPPGDTAGDRERCPRGSSQTCLSVCSVWWPELQPQDTLQQLIKSFPWSCQEGAILAAHELVFILTKTGHMVGHISPGPITPEHLGIPAAPHLTPFNFAAIWAVWRWCKEDF